MNRARCLGFGLALFLALHSHAFAQSTRAALTTEINTNFADNSSGLITPALARAVYLDMLASFQMTNGTGVGDAAYPMVAGDRYVYTTANLTTPRAWVLPPANSLNKGEKIVVADAFSGVSSSNTLTISRNGTDTINGGTASVVLSVAKGFAVFVTDGVSNWGANSPNVPNFANGAVPIVSLANIAANTVLSNWTSAPAAVVANAWPSCSTATSALQYTTNSGLGCGTSFASLVTADQTLSGGANITASNQGTKSSGTFTVDCGVSPGQYIVNNGAFSLAAPANDGSCIVLVTNGASAGAITFTGFSVGANIGDTYATTNTNKYSLFVWRINGVAGYRWAAHQP